MLFVAITVLAMGLGAWMSYRRSTLCYTEWIDPASSRAAKLFPAPEIEQQEDDRYGFAYYAQRRQANSLFGVITSELQRTGAKEYNCKSKDEVFELVTPDRGTAEQSLRVLQMADNLAPGTFVIRGRVVNQKGQPLAGATITMRGPGEFYETYSSRDDGTFTMPLASSREPALPGSGYWFTIQPRVRPGDFRRWTSRGFSLDATQPEMVVLVTVPINSRPSTAPVGSSD